MLTAAKSPQLSEARQIASFIGLDRLKDIDDLALVERVTKGFPVRAVTTVVKRIDPEGRYLKESDIIPKSTLHRREKQQKPLSREESERLLAVSRVFAETLRLYHSDSAKSAQFLTTPHAMLGAKSPMELAIGSIAGADLVLKLLQKADAGQAA